MLVHRATKAVRVVNRIQFSLFDVGLCIVKLVYVVKQPRQGVVNPEKLTMPVEGGCNSDDRFGMLNGLLSVTLGSMYKTEKAMRIADPIRSALVQREFECVGGSFLRGVKLIVIKQRPT